MNCPKASAGKPSTSSYKIRKAQGADLDQVCELILALQDHLESTNPDLWRMTPTARENLKGQIATRLTAAKSCTLVAEHNEDGVVGVIFGRIITNHRYSPSRAGQVDQAFVHVDHRRLGLASRLVDGLCQFFAAYHVDQITLRYAERNEEATRFWASLGFKPRIIVTGASRLAVEAALTRRQRK
jgi:ribosomal protein S18 acetylase RimI-like enzyme